MVSGGGASSGATAAAVGDDADSDLADFFGEDEDEGEDGGAPRSAAEADTAADLRDLASVVVDIMFILVTPDTAGEPQPGASATKRRACVPNLVGFIFPRLRKGICGRHGIRAVTGAVVELLRVMSAGGHGGAQECLHGNFDVTDGKHQKAFNGTHTTKVCIEHVVEPASPLPSFLLPAARSSRRGGGDAGGARTLSGYRVQHTLLDRCVRPPPRFATAGFATASATQRGAPADPGMHARAALRCCGVAVLRRCGVAVLLRALTRALGLLC